MFNFSASNHHSLFGKLLRLPFRLMPRNATVPILQGPLRGKKWVVGSHIHGCWLGSYEFDKQKKIAQIVQPGSVFLDIGAHVGYYTLLASTLVGESGQVFAFEPFPRNIEYLYRHLGINRIHNAQVFPMAVSDEVGISRFAANHSHSQGQLTGTEGINVRVTMLDRLLDQGILPLPHYIKIDVEGAEYRVLSGARRMLTDSNPIILLATHGPEVHAKCLNLLDSLGYTCKSIDGGKELSSCSEVQAVKR